MIYRGWTLQMYLSHGAYGVFCTYAHERGTTAVTIPAVYRSEFAALRAAIAAVDAAEEVAA